MAQSASRPVKTTTAPRVKAPPDATPFTTDPNDELPVGIQLNWRLRALVLSGRLSPGDRLPSVRQLAEWAGVHVNTVRGVYGSLERGGLLESRHGQGTFVAEDAPATPELERIAAEAIAKATELGVSGRDLAVMAMVCAGVPESLGEELPDEIDLSGEADLELPDIDLEADELRVREEMRRQISQLESVLATYVREANLEVSEEAGRFDKPRLAGVEELERTRDDLLKRLAEAREFAERRGRREERARERLDEMLSDPAAHKWELVDREATGDPGCGSYRSVPRYGPLGVLMQWWRVKVSGGCPLAAPREAAP